MTALRLTRTQLIEAVQPLLDLLKLSGVEVTPEDLQTLTVSGTEPIPTLYVSWSKPGEPDLRHSLTVSATDDRLNPTYVTGNVVGQDDPPAEVNE